MNYALVTGGSGGIGSAICLKLAKMGYPVLIHYNSNQSAAQETLDTIVKENGKAELIQFDISDHEVVKATLKTWKDNHPEDYIAVLVNNAGV